MENNSLFGEFVGHEVKAPYKDGSQFKIARGTLKEINNGFVKIVGNLGTIIINEKKPSIVANLGISKVIKDRKLI